MRLQRSRKERGLDTSRFEWPFHQKATVRNESFRAMRTVASFIYRSSKWQRIKNLSMKKSLSLEIISLCPSAQPVAESSVVLGVINGTPDGPRISYLEKPLAATEDILSLTGSVPPTEVLRIGAPCAGHDCRHYDGSTCRLVTRVVQLLPPVVDALPPCSIRLECRWWQQEGKAACLRCPQVVTDINSPSELVRRVADPHLLTIG